MKAIAILFVLLVLLAAGCTPRPSGPAPASPPVPEAVISSSPEPAPTSPPATTPQAASKQPTTPTREPEQTPAQEPAPPASKDAAPQFLWTVDPGVRLEDATVPNIYRLGDGRFRLFFGGPGGILSAISDSGLTFTKEPGVRVPSGSPGSPEMIVSDPTLVSLKDGKVRMFYKGATGSGGPGQSGQPGNDC